MQYTRVVRVATTAHQPLHGPLQNKLGNFGAALLWIHNDIMQLAQAQTNEHTHMLNSPARVRRSPMLARGQHGMGKRRTAFFK